MAMPRRWNTLKWTEDIRLANELATELMGHSLDELSRPAADLLQLLVKMQTKPAKDTGRKNRRSPKISTRAYAGLHGTLNGLAIEDGTSAGSPRQTGQTLVFGGAPKLAGTPAEYFGAGAELNVKSSPITGSVFA